MKSILFNAGIFREEEERYFFALHKELTSHGIDFKITAAFNLGRDLDFIVPNPVVFGEFFDNFGLASLLTDAEIAEAEKLAHLWGRREQYDARCIRRLALGYETQLRVLQPSLVILWNRYTLPSRVLEFLAKKFDIPTLTLERTPFPYLLSLDPMGSLCDSKIYQDALDQFSAMSDAAVHENLLVDQYQKRLSESDLTWWPQPNRLTGDELRNRLGIPDGRKIVLFLGQVDNDIQNFRHNPFFDDNLAAFRAFLRSLSTGGEYYVLGKHHPKASAPPSNYQHFLDRDLGIWTTELSIKDAFDLADYVVAVNSAGAFEAILQGIPTMTLGKSMYSGLGIFFEWKSAADYKVTEEWLSADHVKMAARVFRARSVLQFFLERDFYFFGVDSDTIKGVSELALRLADLGRDLPLRSSKSLPSRAMIDLSARVIKSPDHWVARLFVGSRRVRQFLRSLKHLPLKLPRP